MNTTSANLISDSDEPVGSDLVELRVRMKKILLPVFVFLVLGICLLPLDLWLMKVMNADHLPRSLKFLREIVETSEFFGHGVGIIYIAFTLFLLDHPGRKKVYALITLLVISSLSSNMIKLVVGRDRPRDTTEEIVSVSNTWTGFFPRLKGNRVSQSFPSAHTTAAVCLAVTLGVMYPQGRYLFLFMAMMVGLQRIMFQAHYPSDVMGGAALGWLIASWGTSRFKVFQERAGNVINSTT